MFEPGRIGRLWLKNRIIMAPLWTRLPEPDEEGRVGQRYIDYCVARARGGVGLIITTQMRTSRKWEASVGEPAVSSLRCIAWLNDLAEAVHDYGTKLCVQLCPGFGRNQPPDPALPHGGTIAPSPIPNLRDPGIICRELAVEEVEQMVRDFEFSSRVISAAGIDAIELHAHLGYLIDEFMTPLWNKRTDKYGGDLAGRLRFPLELIEAVKRGAGKDFPISFRYGLSHYLPGGRDIEEGLEIARRLEAAGVSVLHIDAGCYDSPGWGQPPTTRPPGCLVPLAEMTKRAVSIPVIAVGKLGDPELAERVLQEGKADFIALGRPLLADPDWPQKVRQGNLEDIVPCTGCHEGCLKRLVDGKRISCAVNPACGQERELTISPAEREKTVLVVGGGPAGMEAARVAALRGHGVTLWEKGHTLGGNLISTAIPDFKYEYQHLLDYLITQVGKLGVTIEFGMEATLELVQRMNPDVAIIATGATPVTEPVKCSRCGICDTSKFEPAACYISRIKGLKSGLAKGAVITSVEALLARKEVGESVVVVGGGRVGCETALWLARKGKKVSVIVRHEAMRDMFWMNAADVADLLNDAGARVLTYRDVLEVTDKGVVIAGEPGDRSTLEADTVILALRLKSDSGLVEALQGKLPEVYAIGDCVAPRLVMDAVREGFRTARLI
ncbi:MAG TPA: FAD-dependent oxidoreductase [Dehalococcoidia bacterium]|nr:FAD-dependent oxidoreductase [Dehalococcoidia bacterium]